MYKILALATLGVLAGSAGATTLTENIDFSLANFVDLYAIGVTSPVLAIDGSFTVSYDPTKTYEDDTTDLVFSPNSQSLVFGSSATTWNALGTLKWARCSREKARSSSGVAVLPACSTTNAVGDSPHFSCGIPTTATSNTAGWRSSVRSM